MKHLNTAQIDKDFSEVVNEVAKDKERVILTSHGKELAAIVPVEDIKLLEELEEEDRQDIEAAQAA
jgi:prevent-host-death family protein